MKLFELFRRNSCSEPVVVQAGIILIRDPQVYLVRSSPALNERLLRSRTFGPLMRDWQQHAAMRPGVKVVTLVIMVGMVTATVLFADLSGLVVVVLLVGLGLYSVLRVPNLPDNGNRQKQA